MNESDFSCRSCKGGSAHTLLDMGDVPLANAFVSSTSDNNDSFLAPLRLVMCNNCRLIQISDIVDRQRLFSDYLWVTATSEAAAVHAPWLASRLAERHLGGDNNFLVEIASNDGFFLRHYRESGFRILGVDPSNVALDAAAAGLPTIRGFFGCEVARRIVQEHGQPNVIVARNVLGHSSELRDLIEGISLLLAPGGRLVIEHPYAYLMREEVQYDQIFHEHVSYPTIQSVSNLLRQFGMKIVDVNFVNMNGGSILAEAARKDDPAPEAGVEIRQFENFIHLNEPDGWDNFRSAVSNQRNSLVELLERLHDEKALVVGYGAAAKCMTMLNFCGIDNRLVAAFGDANPKKQGLLCPGVRIPVVSPEELVSLNPEYILLGAWNLKKEIIRQFREEWNYRGKFICPVPVATVI
jgi:SAM-dependent methyltransferase